MARDEPDVHLHSFNGPLELLLKLIQRDKMNIYDIQISAITAQYLKYVHRLKSLDLNVVGDFLVMAAKLMDIKSRMLLPKRKSNSDDSDPRRGLVSQLLVYKKYKRAAKELQGLELKRKASYTRPAVVPSKSNHLINLHDQISANVLKQVFQRVIKRRISRKPISENVTEWHYSVKDQASKVIQCLDTHPEVTLKRLFSANVDLEELITNFLAVLDLIKEHRIMITRNHQIKLVKSGD